MTRHHRDIEGIEAARAARREAERRLNNALSREPEVQQQAERLSELKKRNGFGEAIARAFRRRRSA